LSGIEDYFLEQSLGLTVQSVANLKPMKV